MYEEEGAGDGDADAEGDEVGEEEIWEVEESGDADVGYGEGREGAIWEKSMYGCEVVDEDMNDLFCRGRGRCGGRTVGGVAES